jgi:hypothetical protein
MKKSNVNFLSYFLPPAFHCPIGHPVYSEQRTIVPLLRLFRFVGRLWFNFFMDEHERYGWMKAFEGKKILVVLKNNFKYTTTNLQLIDGYILFSDRNNMRVTVACEDVARMEEIR